MARPVRWISVFGSSEPREGEPLYEEARRVGSLLADAGFGVLTGGYGGVMEGASRGARERGGGARGVPCSIFRGRDPNRFLTETRPTSDLFERTRHLIEPALGFIVLRGKSGTLAEIAFLWALRRAGSLGPRPVVLLGDPWVSLLRHLVRDGMIEETEIAGTRVAASPEEAVTLLTTAIVAGSEG